MLVDTLQLKKINEKTAVFRKERPVSETLLGNQLAVDPNSGTKLQN